MDDATPNKVDTAPEVLEAVSARAERFVGPASRIARCLDKYIFQKPGDRINKCVRSIDLQTAKLTRKQPNARLSYCFGAWFAMIIILGPSVNWAAWSIPGLVDNPIVTFSLAVLVGIAVCYGLRWLDQNAKSDFPLFCGHAVIALVGLLVFIYSDLKALTSTFYPHVFLFVLPIALAYAVVWRVCAEFMFKREVMDVPGGLHEGFRLTDFTPRVRKSDVEVSLVHMLKTSIGAPLYNPFLFLWLISAGVVGLAAFSLGSEIAFWLWVATVWFILALAYRHPHWDLLADMLNRWVLVGGAGLVSMLVIVLALGQLLQIDYVTTLIPGGPTISLILSAYLTFWIYEYWLNRFFYVPMFRAIRKQMIAEDPNYKSPSHIWFADSIFAFKTGVNGACAFHASNRVAVRTDRLYVYTGKRFLERLATQNSSAHKYLGRKSDVFIGWAESMNRKRKAYFVLSNVIPAVAAVLFYLIGGFDSKVPNSVLQVKSVYEDSGIVMSSLLESQDSPMVVTLAGGGTRAALYSASVLCGLQNPGQLKDVVLVSSVSGGTAAAAYFVMNREELVRTSCNSSVLMSDSDNIWSKFYSVMASDFINDVLRGAVEPRIITPSDDQLGVLLAESFEHRISKDSPSTGIADISDIGFIFNATLTGHPYERSTLLQGLFDNGVGASREANLRHDEVFRVIGGRVLFTNMSTFQPWSCGSRIQDQCLAYRAFGPDYHVQKPVEFEGRSIPISYAAAISANFPPVFSDAGIKVDTGEVYENGSPILRQYWATDGGALDNRGVDAALFVLKREARLFAGKTVKLVIVDGGANAIDHEQTRGISAGLSTMTTLMSELVVRDIEGLEQLGVGIQPFYVELPIALRTRGGLGTHWKMQPTVFFRNPQHIDPAEEHQAEAGEKKVKELIAQLHEDASCTVSVDPKYAPFLCADRDYQTSGWERLVEHVSGD